MFKFCSDLLDRPDEATFEVALVRLNRMVNGTIAKVKKQIGFIPTDAIEVTHLSLSRNANLPWSHANEMIELEAAEHWFEGPVDSAMLLHAGHCIQTNGTISLGRLLPSVMNNEAGCQASNTRRTMLALILKYLPVGAFGAAEVDGNCVLIDLQSVTGAQTFNERLACHVYDQKKEQNKKASKSKRKRGRKPVETKIDKLVEAVIEIVQAHAPEASPKRRHEIVKTGISLQKLLKELKDRFKGLEMDKRTLARLMCPPNQGNKAASAYKQLVKARITTMQNDLRIEKDDAHYSCAQVSLLKEMLAWIGTEVTLVSCDEKAQLVIGEAGLVSRLVCTCALSFRLTRAS